MLTKVTLNSFTFAMDIFSTGPARKFGIIWYYYLHIIMLVSVTAAGLKPRVQIAKNLQRHQEKQAFVHRNGISWLECYGTNSTDSRIKTLRLQKYWKICDFAGPAIFLALLCDSKGDTCLICFANSMSKLSYLVPDGEKTIRLGISVYIWMFHDDTWLKIFGYISDCSKCLDIMSC